MECLIWVSTSILGTTYITWSIFLDVKYLQRTKWYDTTNCLWNVLYARVNLEAQIDLIVQYGSDLSS